MVGTICYSFRSSKLKIVAVLFFFNAWYFRWRTSFFGLVHLWRPITPVQNLTRPISSTFSETSGREVSHRPILDISPFEQISRNEHLMSNFFLHFFVATPKKNSSGRRSDNIEDWRLPHFEADVPTFSKYLWKLAISLKLPTPKLDDPGPLPPKWVFLDQFNEENNFFGTFWPNEYPQVLYMVGKLRISSFLIK